MIKGDESSSLVTFRSQEKGSVTRKNAEISASKMGKSLVVLERERKLTLRVKCRWGGNLSGKEVKKEVARFFPRD